jgi:hypothetical protein
MNLTTLRRLAWVGNAAALAAAGAAGWFAWQTRPVARDEKEWPKAFPVKKGTPADLERAGPGARDLYTAAVDYPQGDKPPEKKPEAEKVEAPKVDPFKTKYRLNGVFASEKPYESYAQLLQTGLDRAFSVLVGERILAEPTAIQENPALTPWALHRVSTGTRDPQTGIATSATATFVNVDTGEEQTLEVSFQGPGTLQGKPDLTSKVNFRADEEGKPPRNQTIRAIRGEKHNPAAGIYEWDIPEGETDFLLAWSEDEAKAVAAVPSKGPDGQPNGFTLKSVKPGSRAAEYGFQAEDRVISVNSVPVNSVENAVAVGKGQYEEGKASFQVKAIRKGKEVNLTFRAARKKEGGAAPTGRNRR